MKLNFIPLQITHSTDSVLSSHDEFIKKKKERNDKRNKEQSRMTDEGLNRDIHLSLSLLLCLEATECHKTHLK